MSCFLFCFNSWNLCWLLDLQRCHIPGLCFFFVWNTEYCTLYSVHEEILFILSVYKVTKHVGEYQTFEVIYTAAHVRRRCRPRPAQPMTGWQDLNATATVRQCVCHEVHWRLSVTANWSLEMRTGKQRKRTQWRWCNSWCNGQTITLIKIMHRDETSPQAHFDFLVTNTNYSVKSAGSGVNFQVLK